MIFNLFSRIDVKPKFNLQFNEIGRNSDSSTEVNFFGIIISKL